MFGIFSMLFGAGIVLMSDRISRFGAMAGPVHYRRMGWLMGWIAAVVLACRSARLERLTLTLAAVGRTAFSNYILQTIICTTLFYGHGFGLFGTVSRVGQFFIVVAVWVLLLVVSPLWLRYFAYGPLEWLWRSLTYWRRMPFVRSVAV
jgi:uncharacterized protein